MFLVWTLQLAWPSFRVILAEGKSGSIVLVVGWDLVVWNYVLPWSVVMILLLAFFLNSVGVVAALSGIMSAWFLFFVVLLHLLPRNLSVLLRVLFLVRWVASTILWPVLVWPVPRVNWTLCSTSFHLRIILNAAHALLLKWLPRSSLAIEGLTWEIIWSGPHQLCGEPSLVVEVLLWGLNLSSRIRLSLSWVLLPNQSLSLFLLLAIDLILSMRGYRPSPESTSWVIWSKVGRLLLIHLRLGHILWVLAFIDRVSVRFLAFLVDHSGFIFLVEDLRLESWCVLVRFVRLSSHPFIVRPSVLFKLLFNSRSHMTQLSRQFFVCRAWSALVAIVEAVLLPFIRSALVPVSLSKWFLVHVGVPGFGSTSTSLFLRYCWNCKSYSSSRIFPHCFYFHIFLNLLLADLSFFVDAVLNLHSVVLSLDLLLDVNLRVWLITGGRLLGWLGCPWSFVGIFLGWLALTRGNLLIAVLSTEVSVPALASTLIPGNLFLVWRACVGHRDVLVARGWVSRWWIFWHVFVAGVSKTTHWTILCSVCSVKILHFLGGIKDLNVLRGTFVVNVGRNLLLRGVNWRVLAVVPHLQVIKGWTHLLSLVLLRLASYLFSRVVVQHVRVLVWVTGVCHKVVLLSWIMNSLGSSWRTFLRPSLLLLSMVGSSHLSILHPTLIDLLLHICMLVNLSDSCIKRVFGIPMQISVDLGFCWSSLEWLPLVWLFFFLDFFIPLPPLGVDHSLLFFNEGLFHWILFLLGVVVVGDTLSPFWRGSLARLLSAVFRVLCSSRRLYNCIFLL